VGSYAEGHLKSFYAELVCCALQDPVRNGTQGPAAYVHGGSAFNYGKKNSSRPYDARRHTPRGPETRGYGVRPDAEPTQLFGPDMFATR